jgi:hypothetical protein
MLRIPLGTPRIDGEHAASEEMPLHTIGEEQAKVLVASENLKHERRAAVVIAARDVICHARHDDLGIPAMEVPASVRVAPSRGVPILVSPVGVARVEVNENVVCEVLDLEELRDPSVLKGLGDVGSYQVEEKLVSIRGTRKYV